MQQHLCGELDEPFLYRAGGNSEVGVSHQGKVPQGNRGTNPDRNLWNIVGRLSALNYFGTWQIIGVVSLARWQFIPFTFWAWIWPASWNNRLTGWDGEEINLFHVPHGISLTLFLHLNQFNRSLGSRVSISLQLLSSEPVPLLEWFLCSFLWRWSFSLWQPKANSEKVKIWSIVNY